MFGKLKKSLFNKSALFSPRVSVAVWFIAVGIFSIGFLVLFFRILPRNKAEVVISDWTAPYFVSSQAVRSLDRFIISLDEFKTGRLAKKELILQFDILWSRAHLYEKNSEVGKVLNDVPANVDTIQRLQKALTELDPIVQKLTLRDSKNIQRVHQTLLSFHKPLYEISMDLYTSEMASRTKAYDKQAESFHLLGYTLIAFVLSGLILLSLAFRGIKETEKLLLKYQKQKKELEEATSSAQKASVAKSEFLATMSHEIRTPLNSILGITSVLAESDLKTEYQQLVRICDRAGKTLLTLVNDILDYSKLEANELRLEEVRFDLIETVASVTEILRQNAKEKCLNLEVAFDFASANQSHEILGDVNRVQQVLMNLVGNAIKFTGTGCVTIRVSHLDVTKRDLLFEIEDTGIGISDNKKEFIFHKFAQADTSITRRFGGTGLGLAITKNLVELMGGKIWFRSTENVGSTFYFTLPNTAAGESLKSAISVETKESFNFESSSHRIQVLVVDDNEDNRFLIQTYLKKYPIDVAMAEDGSVALNKVKVNSYDVVFMDIQMPEMDGHTATALIRQWEQAQRKRQTPIVAISANAMSNDVELSLKAGCNEHIAKPVKKDALLGLIQKYVAINNGTLSLQKPVTSQSTYETPA